MSRLCEECGEEISAARLKAVPSTMLCRDCKEREEKSAPPPIAPVAYVTLDQLHKQWLAESAPVPKFEYIYLSGEDKGSNTSPWTRVEPSDGYDNND